MASSSVTPKIVELPPDGDDSIDIRKAPNGTTMTSRRISKLAKGKKSETAAPPPSWTWLLLKWSLVAVLTAFGAAQFIAGDLLWGYRGKYTKVDTYMPPPKRVFTPKELWEYNGTDPDKPVYVSIMGKVYDVTPNRWIYGPRGTYHFFAGRDASRAYVTGCFDTHLTHDLRGLSLEEIQQVAQWKTFFDEHHKYKHIGTVDLPTIDPKSPIPEPCNDNVESKDPNAVIS